MFTEKFKSILLFSGGIDSFCAYHYLGKPQTVYFDLKTRYAQKERKYVLQIIPSTIIDNSLNLSDREYGEKAYVPFRNLLLAAQAVKYSDTIYIAGLKDDKVSDKNESVFKRMSALLSEMERRQIQILSPFWEMTKAQVVEWYLKNVTSNPEKLLSTVSCYSEEDTNYCGKCPCCFRKWNALQANGIDIDFYNESLIDEYYNKALQGEYIPERNTSIIQVIDAYRNRHRRNTDYRH
jgi:7-cyano-7-deazaguanine synthase in queuosine biosynthesis